MPTVGISAIADGIERICTEYVEELDKKTKQAVSAAARKTRDKLSQYNSKRGLGRYGASWSVHSEGDSLLGYSSTVYSKMPGLPHLIEFGHGGPQPAPPHPHMDAAYQAGVQELESRLR